MTSEIVELPSDKTVVAMLINNAKLMEFKFIFCRTLGEPIHTHKRTITLCTSPANRSLNQCIWGGSTALVGGVPMMTIVQEINVVASSQK